jgi:hypothetical protein
VLRFASINFDYHLALGQCLGGFLLQDFHLEQLECIQLPSALKKQYESRVVQSHKLTGEVEQAAFSVFHVLDASVQDVPMPYSTISSR